MTPIVAGRSFRPPGLRLWPGVAIVALMYLLRFGLPAVYPDGAIVAVFSALAGSLAVIVWWACFSRAPRVERWGAPVLMALVSLATVPLLDPSIATSMMGLMFPVYTAPVLSLALVGWAIATRHLPDARRRTTMVATIVVASGLWTVLRTDGMWGTAGHDLNWRWAATAEARLLASTADEPLAPAPAAPTAGDSAAWPGFRGPHRDSVVRGLRIGTDWIAHPPVELWRRPVGPGISSFAVLGNLVYTQEQRGEEETVSAYRLDTGDPVWRHADPVRFWDSHAGAGPRATPTLDGARLFSLGGTGLLNALDARTGARIWSRDVATELGVSSSGWGFAGSPLVVGDVVVVAGIGRLAGYDRKTGAPRWVSDRGGDSYSSPHPVTIDGVPQVVLLAARGITSVAPKDGAVLWSHAWPTSTRIVQPALTPDGDLLLGSDGSIGLRRLVVSRTHEGWHATERWTSTHLKPYFNDLVVHRDHAYGFDGSILASIDLRDGERAWKGGRYGNGQLLLLPDQDLLLVLAEEGDLALVSATPDGYTELARVPALTGKSWNHPALVGDTLLVRNAEEMAAFRLPSP